METYNLQEVALSSPGSHMAYISTLTGVRSALECAALCDRDRLSCASSVYWPHTSSCGLSDYSEVHSASSASLTPAVFLDSECVIGWTRLPVWGVQVHAASLSGDFYLLMAVTRGQDSIGVWNLWQSDATTGTQPVSRHTCNCTYLNGERMKAYSQLRLIRFQVSFK